MSQKGSLDLKVQHTGKKTQEVIFYDIDLNKSVSDRWDPIINIYAKEISMVKEEIKKLFKSMGIIPNLIKPAYYLTNSDNILHYDEICYFAEKIGLDTYELLLLQLIYEISSACTTFIIRTADSKEIYFRTMDWNMMFLKDITIGLNVNKNGRPIGKVITWLGYCGYLTATSSSVFGDTNVYNYSIAINYRRTQNISIKTFLQNFHRTLSMNWPIGYLVRYIINNELSEEKALQLLQQAQLISPCYITFYVPNGNSVIITRDHDKTVDCRQHTLYQTNCDWDKNEPNILYSNDRCNLIENIKKSISKKSNPEIDDIIKIILRFPIKNEETIYYHYQYDGQFKAFCV